MAHHKSGSFSVAIREAIPGEEESLRAIAIASKSYWGYDLDWVTEWAAHGGFSPEALQNREIYVAEINGVTAGWSAVIPKGHVCWLDDLWVEPAWIGKGIGSLLFRRGVERARELGAKHVEWEAEPNAIGFYEKMGGRYLRDSDGKEWGRVLPVMGLTLTPGPDSAGPSRST